MKNMNNPDNFNYYWISILMLRDVFLGAIGGVISYLFDYSKAKRTGSESFTFKMSELAVNMALGAFVAYIAGTLIPHDTAGRDAMIGFSGVTSYQILLIAESKFAVWIFDKVTGTKTTKKDEKDV